MATSRAAARKARNARASKKLRSPVSKREARYEQITLWQPVVMVSMPSRGDPKVKVMGPSGAYKAIRLSEIAKVFGQSLAATRSMISSAYASKTGRRSDEPNY